MSRDLGGVKVGDKLKVSRQWSNQFDEYTVKRVTATRAICECNTAFMIDSGLMVGTGNFRNRKYASFITDEDRAKARLEARINNACKAMRGISVTANNIDAAEAFIKASQPKEQAQQNKENK